MEKVKKGFCNRIKLFLFWFDFKKFLCWSCVCNMVQGNKESLQFQNSTSMLFERLNWDIFVKKNLLRMDLEFWMRISL